MKNADTVFFNFTKTGQRKYQFEFAAANLEQDNLAGFVEDKYLNKATPLNMTGTTKLDFEVTAHILSVQATQEKFLRRLELKLLNFKRVSLLSSNNN